jgi:isoamylase
VLRSRHFMHGKEELAPGVADISWFDQHGELISVDAWNNPNERVIVLRRAQRDDGAVQSLTLMLNPTGDSLPFRLPAPRIRSRVLIDTCRPDAPEHNVDGDKIEVASRSAVLIIGTHEAPA